MLSITQHLTSLVSAAFEACGYDPSLGAVTLADRADLGQFQCNGAFAGAKLHRKAPAAIAGDVVAKLQEDPAFAAVAFAPPGFINMTLSEAYLVTLANRLREEPLAEPAPPADAPPLLIDYGGPNVAKPLHIGHLRSAIIGEGLKRLARFMGYRVIADTHIGDWGLQMGLVITALEDAYLDSPCFGPDYDPATDAGTLPALDVSSLNDIYPAASKRSKEDAAFLERARRATYELQQGRPGYTDLWREIVRVSVADARTSYARLDVSFDLWYGESTAAPLVPQLLEILEQKSLLRESDGAMVVDIAREGDKVDLPPAIVKKSDNSDIYVTTDLATILLRQRDFAPRAIWYLTDARQELHFTQVFRVARKAALLPSATELVHMGFGTVNGEDGKPYKTRDGGVMQLSALLDIIRDGAMEKLRDSAYIATLGEEEKAEIAERVAVAAIKFGDLINFYRKDYVFSLERFLSFEGKTGPYLLYMLTRIHSILRKAGVDYDASLPLAKAPTGAEADLLLKLLTAADAFRHALAERALNHICESAYQIAAQFSKFYHECRILDEPDEELRQSRLGLILLVRRLLAAHLDILGIGIVENM